jgi:hypothetical protein
MATIHRIISYASDGSLANMALTHRDLQRPSQKALWMCMFIYTNGDIIQGQCNVVTIVAEQLNSKHHGGGLEGFINHLSIVGVSEVDISPTPFKHISRVLPHLANLKSIIFSSAITEEIGYMADIGSTMSRFLPEGFERLILMMSEVSHHEHVLDLR